MLLKLKWLHDFSVGFFAEGCARHFARLFVSRCRTVMELHPEVLNVQSHLVVFISSHSLFRCEGGECPPQYLLQTS